MFQETVKKVEIFYKKNDTTFYDISSEGEVRSFFRGKFHKKKIDFSGRYPSVNAKVNGKSKHYTVHRLLGKLFIPNPLKLKYINHIDGDKMNYSLSNLEWCTRSENELHAWSIGLKKKKYGRENHRARRIGKFLNGTLVKAYDALIEAESDGHKLDCICSAAKRDGTSGGFHWKYLDK